MVSSSVAAVRISIVLLVLVIGSIIYQNVFPRMKRNQLDSTYGDLQLPSSVNIIQVQVQFYGESMCPFCRKFVTEAWQQVWLDVEGLRPYIDYDMIAWGNAYFATEECGGGPMYSIQERECWYQKCQPKCNVVDNKDVIDCFSGPAIYQHGTKEGVVDIYETCIKVDYSLEDAVAFTYCAEGSIMDNDNINAEQLLHNCTVSLPNVDAEAVQECFQKRGRQLEVANAKQTPVHPGVPYVLLDGIPLDNPMDIQAAICQRLKEKGLRKLPDSCGGESNQQ